MRLIDADAFKAYMRNALEQTRNAYPDKGEWAETITEQFCEDIDDQPTVYPDTDTISRQQATDALKEALNPSKGKVRPYDSLWDMYLDEFEDDCGERV